MIQKSTDVYANIDVTKNADIGSIKAYFYTEDKGVSQIRIYIMNNGRAINLKNEEFSPSLNLFMQDGSIFMNEKVEIDSKEKGLIIYQINDEVIKHVGNVNAKLFLKSEEKSIHVANFSFNILSSGIEGSVQKEIKVTLIEDTVRKIIEEDIGNFVDEELVTEIKNRVGEDVKQFTKDNPQLFKGEAGAQGIKGDKGDTGVVDKLYLYNKLNNLFSEYEIPSSLKINVPFSIYVNKNGEVKFDYDVSEQKNPVEKTYYVDIKTGDNNNAGTKSEPFKSIHRAFRYGDADEIIVNEGVYGWSDSFSAYSQAKPFNLIGKGNVIIGAHRDKLVWTKNTSYSNVYQTIATSVIELIDCKNLEDIHVMNKQTSIQKVSENKNSYYIDSSNNLYVRTYDDRLPDERILPNLTTDAAKIEGNPKVYFENLTFTNTVKLTATTNDQHFYAKNCYFTVGTGNNALSVEGYDYNILQNCTASHATRDGFNYHIKNGLTPKAIEIDCVGFNNGRDGANQNNGSTMHDGGHIIRINGEYYNNAGPNVIDVNEGTVSVNVGVHSHSSKAEKNTVSNSNFKNGNIGNSKMYLVNCLSNGSDYSVVTSTSQGSMTEIENSLLIENQTTV